LLIRILGQCKNQLLNIHFSYLSDLSGIQPETIVLLKKNWRQIEAIAMEAVEEEERAVSLSSAERQF
jgi:hypothetical protein